MDNDKPSLRLHFVDYYSSFNPMTSTPVRILSDNYNIVIDSEKPDIIFYSSFGWKHLYYKEPLKVFWTGENEYPDFNSCDYSISHLRDSVGGKNHWWAEGLYVIAKPNPLPDNPTKRPFASFIASFSGSYGAGYREEFVRYLMKMYKRVDCPGKALNNIKIPDLEPRNGKWHASKQMYIGRYKFNIAFENSNTDGYITEKLTDCFVANTVPIYWGSEGNLSPFPKEAMICANDYSDFSSLIARIKEVDENEDLYLSILHANPLRRHDFIAEHQSRLMGLSNFLNKIAIEALGRKLYRGYHMIRPLGNRLDIADCIMKIEEESRPHQKSTALESYNANSQAVDIQDVLTKVRRCLEDFSLKSNDLYHNFERRQKEDAQNVKQIAMAINISRYKREFFYARVLSHLLPKYRGGVYTKRKRQLRKLIGKLESIINDLDV